MSPAACEPALSELERYYDNLQSVCWYLGGLHRFRATMVPFVSMGLLSRERYLCEKPAELDCLYAIIRIVKNI